MSPLAERPAGGMEVVVVPRRKAWPRLVAIGSLAGDVGCCDVGCCDGSGGDGSGIGNRYRVRLKRPRRCARTAAATLRRDEHESKATHTQLEKCARHKTPHGRYSTVRYNMCARVSHTDEPQPSSVTLETLSARVNGVLSKSRKHTRSPPYYPPPVTSAHNITVLKDEGSAP